VKFIYVIAIIMLVFMVVAIIVASFTEAVSGIETIGYLVLAPVVGLLYLLFVRVWLELVVVIFRIGETAGEIRDLLSGQSPTPGAETGAE
jgi:glycerol-3-phosphate acyltransferase PlsY